MTIDLLGLAVLLAFAAVGAWRGALASATGVATLVLGYAAAIWAGKALGPGWAEAAGWPGLAGQAVAGTVGFTAVFLVGGLAGVGLRAWDRRRRGDLPRGAADRAGGALFGAMRGVMIVLLVGWAAVWADAARRLTDGRHFAAAPATEDSVLAGAAGGLAERAVEWSLEGDGDPGGARMAARMASRPAETLEAARDLIEDPRVRALQGDRLFWTYVQNGAVDSALNRASFWRVVHDDALRGELAELGLVTPEAAADPARFREEAGRVLEEVGPRIKNLAEDPELQRLARDPEVLELVQAGDTFALMARPDVQRLVARLTSTP